MVLEPSLCFCFCCCFFFCAVSCAGWDGMGERDPTASCRASSCGCLRLTRHPHHFVKTGGWARPKEISYYCRFFFFSFILHFFIIIDQSRKAYTYCSTYNQCHVGLGFKFDPVFTWSREPCYKINSHPLPAVAVLTKKIVTTILFKE